MASLTLVLVPSDGTFNPSDLEIVDTYNVAMRPRDAAGNHIVFLDHCDLIGADAAYIERHDDSAYGAFIGVDAAQYDTVNKVFGAASVKIGPTGSSSIHAEYSARYNNLSDFTVDFRLRPTAVNTTKWVCGEVSQIGIHGRWWLKRINDELRLRTYNAAGAFHDLPSTGAGLLSATWGDIRLTYHAIGDNTSESTISVNGTEVGTTSASKLLSSFLGADFKPMALGGYRSAVGLIAGSESGNIEEWIVYDSVLPSNYTPPVAAMAPFATTSPTNVMTGDSGVANSVIDMSKLISLVETAFDSSNLKVRVNSDNNNTPSFSGPLLTLTQARALGYLVGRYFHVEISFISGGDHNYILHPMIVEVILAVAVPSTPTISGVNDATGTSATITIDGDAGTTNYIYYKKVGAALWTLFGSRVGDGDIVVTGLTQDPYDFIGISSTAGMYSLFSNQIEVIVSSGEVDDPLLGSSSKDLAFIEKKIAETYLTFQGRYLYHVLKPLDAQPHETNVYGETDYEDSLVLAEYYDPVSMPLVVKVDPEQDLLDRFGLDEPVEALVVASQKVMRDSGIAPKIGDRFDFNEWQFEIKTCKIGSWFSNAKTPCEWIMTVDKVHTRGSSS